jgi:hypothetical protein
VLLSFRESSYLFLSKAFFVWLPLQTPSTEFRNEILYAGGITAFIGATVFFIFSLFLMLEAINENRTECFGWAVEQVLEDQNIRSKIQPDTHGCEHHHHNRENLVGKSAGTGTKSQSRSEEKALAGNGTHNSTAEGLSTATWVWYPSWNSLRHHFIYEIGFVACLFQLTGAYVEPMSELHRL